MRVLMMFNRYYKKPFDNKGILHKPIMVYYSFLYNYMPVSYTHLDVYKRQTINRAMTKIMQSH